VTTTTIKGELGAKHGIEARIIIIVVAGLILSLFVVSQFTKTRPEFIGYGYQMSIFYRNYHDTGVLDNYFIPTFNFAHTDPPSDPYLSKPPLTPLMGYALATIFGDHLHTYLAMIVSIHVLFFAMLAWFSARRWGMTAGLLVLFFSAFSKYAIRFGTAQSFEELSILGMFAAIFLYFEWLDNSKDKFLLLSVIVYLVGLASDYLAFFAAFAIVSHWLFFVKGKTGHQWRLIALFPVTTMLTVLLTVVLMTSSHASLQSWLERAQVRASDSSWVELLRALISHPLTLLGPSVIVAAASVLLYLQYRYLRYRTTALPVVGTTRDLPLLHTLWVAGLLPLVIFKNAYVIHRHWTMFLLPFLVIGTTLAIITLLQTESLHRIIRFSLIGLIALAFIAVSIQGVVADFGTPQPTSETRAHALLLTIADAVSNDEAILVLGTYNDSARVSAHYILDIPSLYANPPEWETALNNHDDYTLVMSTDAASYALVRNQADLQLVAADDEIAIYRVA